MPFISSRSRNSSNLNTDANHGLEIASSGQASASAGSSAPSRPGRSGNHRLQAITTLPLEKEKRQAVKAVAADYKKLQQAGIRGTDAMSIDAGRTAYIESLTETQTRLAQIAATGLSEQAPPASLSRSTKNNLALAGGVASKIAQIGTAGAVIAGVGAVAAAVTPVTVAMGILMTTASVAVLEISPHGVMLAGWPAYAAYKFLRRNGVANALGRMNAYPRASAYAARQRLPTSVIAAITAAQVSDELTRFYRETLTEEERAIIDAQASLADSSTILPAAMFPQAEPVEISAPVSHRGQLGRWQFQEDEENAAAFNTFQGALAETAEYRNNLSNPALVTRINMLVDAMRTSPALRATCFTIASDSIQSCGDRVALGLNDMEQALISKNAESGKLSVVELFHTGLGLFKKQILDEIALAKINSLRQRGTVMDEIEIRLAYPTELRNRLALSGVTQSMRYRASANVTRAEIASAESKVRAKLKQGEAIDFLAQWQPWCTAMERANPQAFATLTDVIQVARDAISIMPADMTDQQWLNALARQKNDEESLLVDLVKQSTQQLVTHHRLKMA